MRQAIFGAAFFLALTAAHGPGSAAAEPPERLFEFCQSGGGSEDGAGQCRAPLGTVVDPTTGHLYVAEGGRVSEHTSWGGFVKAWGWEVDAGNPQPELQTCTEATGCQSGSSGGGAAGALRLPSGVALDSAAHLYVVDRSNQRVQKFDPDGGPGGAAEFLLTFGKNVNQTKVDDVGASQAEKNVCTAASGDECVAGEPGTGPGEFTFDASGGVPIAVGPGDKVFVGDEDRIQRFSAGGAVEEAAEIELAGAGHTEALALDPSGTDPEGELYVVSENVAKTVYRVDSAGATTREIEVENEEGAEGEPTALAMDAAANLYVVALVPEGSGETGEVLLYDSDGLFEAGFGRDDWGDTAVRAVAVNSFGTVYVAGRIGQDAKVVAYGAEPGFEPPPDVAPEILDQYAASVESTGATVHAEIDPHFWTTDYYVEYGLEDCSASACAEQPLSPGTELEGTHEANTATVELSGLEPGATYHYRFVAESDAPSSEGSPTFGPGQTFTTPAASLGPLLPDGRVYELVSPPGKGGGEVGAPTPPSGHSEFSVIPWQASPGGGAITYSSFTAFADPEGAPSAGQYISRRGGEGWSTENINPHFEDNYLRDPFVGFSPGLVHAAVISLNPPLGASAPPDTWNLYTRENAGGAYETVTGVEPSITPGGEHCVAFAGASADFSRVAFVVKSGALLVGDPQPAGSGVNLYEWRREAGPGGHLRLASVLPDGSAATPSQNTSFGAATNFGSGERAKCSMEGAPVHRAVSADGRRMFWTYNGEYAGAAGFVSKPLLARVDGAETVQIDAGEPDSFAAMAGFSGEGKYRAASVDGSKVFFTDFIPLTVASGSGFDHLYRYDFDQPEGERLFDLTPNGGASANVQGTLGAGEAGDTVYFAARAVLAANEGAATDPATSEAQVAEAGEDNVYVWQEGEALRFIAQVPESSNWSALPSARVSPDGGRLAFRSSARLTGYDNTNQDGGGSAAQVYVYDLDADELACASCNPTGARPIGAASLPDWSTPYQQPRYLADSGRVLFQSEDKLDPRDTNGVQDVYQHEPAGVGGCTAASPTFSAVSSGCVNLISSGTSTEPSYLIDASGDGDDAFISTRERLVPLLDSDGSYDIYDARIGGSPYQPPAPPCEGEGCRGDGTAAAATPAPATPAFRGAGNPRECGTEARRAKRLSNRAKRARRNSRQLARNGKRARARNLRRTSRRLARKAKGTSNRAKRCRRANRRAAR